ncbi:MAG: site-2 protease family protein [Patescibacteria group bacterium]
MFIAIIVFIAILALLVLAHELGHFYTARKLGVNVQEFGIGFPPRLFRFKRRDTVYSINLLPLGGFVKLKGESGESRGDPDSFASQKAWKRSIILVAGVSMNIVLAFFLLTIGFTSGLPTIVDQNNLTQARDVKIQIFNVLPDSPAAQAGIKIGDTVVNIDGETFNNLEVMQDYIASHENVIMLVKIVGIGQGELEDGKVVEVAPQVIDQSGGRAVIGVTLIQSGIIAYPWYQSIWMGAKATGFLFYDTVVGFGTVIKNLITEQKAGIEVAGPVGIAVLTGQVVNLGWIYVLQFAALLSVNLAIINILPFPALDGGRLLFVIIEKIRRKPNNQKIEAIIHTFGFGLLMLLVLVITYKDIMRASGDFFSNLTKFFGS